MKRLLVCLLLLASCQKVEKEKKSSYSPRNLEAPPLGASEFWEKKESLPYFLGASLLYWKPYFSQGSVAYVSSNGRDTLPVNAKGVDAPFHWQFGFNVKGGVEFFHKDWLLCLEYLYFKDHRHKTFSSNGASLLYPNNSGILGTNGVTSAKVNKTIFFSSIDLVLDKNFHLPEDVLVDALFGIRNLWLNLHQRLKTRGGEFLHEDTVYNKSASNYWGIGPRLGASTKWLFCNPFYLKALFDFVLQYGIARMKYDEIRNTNPDTKVSYHDTLFNVLPSVDFEGGFGVAEYINGGKQQLSLEISYQIYYFWNKIKSLSVKRNGESLVFSEDESGVSFQGVTASFGLRF